MKASDPKVTKVFNRIVRDQLKLREGEHVLIVVDTATESEKISALTTAINAAGGIFTVLIVPNAGFDPQNLYALTKPAEMAYVAADVVIAASMASSASLYGRPQAFRDMLQRKEKVRLFSLAERPFEVVVNDADTDYFRLSETNKRIRDILRKGRTVRITSQGGTDFRGSLEGIDYVSLLDHLSEHGLCHNPGDFGACPDGEVHVPPPPESMEGVFVADGPIANVCNLRPDIPVKISVKEGRIKKITGGRDAAKLRNLIEELGQDWTSEIGLGTNPNWIFSNSLHATKKGLGNVHIAYGGWWGFQPRIPYRIHGDMVAYNGTLEVDGKVIMADGRIRLD